MPLTAPNGDDRAAQDRTDLVWLAAIAGLLVWEGVTIRNKAQGDLLSDRVWHHAKRRPLIPFLAGVLCGHFFWQESRDEERTDGREAGARGLGEAR